jgi:LacI family transcriptional regulator
MARVSLRSLARELGVSPTAVSWGLSGRPGVSPPLRARVRELAEKRGYIPNAKVTVLMGEVRRSASVFRGSLAAFSFYPERLPWKRPGCAYLEQIYTAAAAAAKTHGYSMDYLWHEEPGMTPRRFARMIETRGIAGLLCLGSADPDRPFPDELGDFAVVTFGASIPTPLHRVASHFAADARLLFAELMARGYRRPGLAITYHGDRRTDFIYSSTFLGVQERTLPGPHVPILRADHWAEDEFARWFRHQRPDVVVLHHPADYVRAAERFLRAEGLRVGIDVGLALLDKNPAPEHFSGMVQNPQQMGRTMTEMLIGRLLLQDFGLPKDPKVELVCGGWNPGATVRARAG